MAEVQADNRKRQALADIENRLNGPPVKPEEDATSGLQFNDRFSKKRRHVIAALFTFATSDPAEECRRRSEAINAVTAPSKRQELRVRKICRSRKTRNEKDGGRTDVDVVSAENLKTRERPESRSLSSACWHSAFSAWETLIYRSSTARRLSATAKD
jgi:hypothetical protein